jgi:hypothetical protein
MLAALYFDRKHMKQIGQREQGPRRNSFWDILVGNGSPLGPKRRLLALIVVAGGILTFFLPLISTQPPVLQTSDWSPFAIVRQIYIGRLPQPICERCGEPAIRSLLALPLDVAVVYGLILSALVVLCVRKSAALAWIGIVGANLSLATYMLRGGTNFATKWEFEKTFYGEPQSLASSSNGPVLYGWLTFALLLVMCALVFVAIREDLDAPTGGPGCRR